MTPLTRLQITLITVSAVLVVPTVEAGTTAGRTFFGGMGASMAITAFFAWVIERSLTYPARKRPLYTRRESRQAVKAGAELVATCPRCRNAMGYLSGNPGGERLALRRLRSLPVRHKTHTAGSDADTAAPVSWAESFEAWHNDGLPADESPV